jgi:hypothetical protein
MLFCNKHGKVDARASGEVSNALEQCVRLLELRLVQSTF